ncbi:MAG: helix-turn-helix domain-containing protein [Acidobacteriia bacterium]|nr:helix-turn-helix domain-containing protein [Terriglobia bacterium]
MTEGRLLTVREAARLTGFTEAAWRSWILHRKVPFHRIGRSVRVAERDLQKLLEESRIPAREERRR